MFYEEAPISSDERLPISTVLEKDKNICINNVKKLLEEITEITDKEIKKNKIIEIFRYLLLNIWFVKDNVNFRNVTISKSRQLKVEYSECKDLVKLCNEMLFRLNQDEEDPNLELYKQMESVICDDDNSVYDKLLNCKIIVKNQNIYKSYNRYDLVDQIIKNKKFLSGEELKFIDSDSIKNTLYVFYELINIGDDTYILIPYETKTFVKKYGPKKI